MTACNREHFEFEDRRFDPRYSAQDLQGTLLKESRLMCSLLDTSRKLSSGVVPKIETRV